MSNENQLFGGAVVLPEDNEINAQIGALNRLLIETDGWVTDEAAAKAIGIGLDETRSLFDALEAAKFVCKNADGCRMVRLNVGQ